MTLFMLKAPNGLKVVSYVKFTQESDYPFLMSPLVDLRPEIRLQSGVPSNFFRISENPK